MIEIAKRVCLYVFFSIQMIFVLILMVVGTIFFLPIILLLEKIGWIEKERP